MYSESFRLSWSRDGHFILAHSGSNMRLRGIDNASLILLPFFGDIGASIRIP